MDEQATRRARVAAVLAATGNDARKVALLKRAVVAVTRRKLDAEAQAASLRAELQRARAEAAAARAECDALRSEQQAHGVERAQRRPQQQQSSSSPSSRRLARTHEAASPRGTSSVNNNNSSASASASASGNMLFGQQVLKGITSLVATTTTAVASSPTTATTTTALSSSSSSQQQQQRRHNGGDRAATATTHRPSRGKGRGDTDNNNNDNDHATTPLPALTLAREDVARIVAENEALHMRIFSAQSECEEAKRALDAAEERHRNEVDALQYELQTSQQSLAAVTAAHDTLQTRTRQLDALVAFCRQSLTLTVTMPVVTATAATTEAATNMTTTRAATTRSSTAATPAARDDADAAGVVQARVTLVTPCTAAADDDDKDAMTARTHAHAHVTRMCGAAQRLLDTVAVLLRTLRRRCVAHAAVRMTLDELCGVRERLQQLCDAHDDQHVRIVSLLDAIQQQQQQHEQQQQQQQDEVSNHDDATTRHDDNTRALHDELLGACVAWLSLLCAHAPLLARALVMLGAACAPQRAALTRLRHELARMRNDKDSNKGGDEASTSEVDGDDMAAAEGDNVVDDDDASRATDVVAAQVTTRLARCVRDALDGLAGAVTAVQLLSRHATRRACVVAQPARPQQHASSSLSWLSSSWWLLLLLHLWLDGCAALPRLRQHATRLVSALRAVAQACIDDDDDDADNDNNAAPQQQQQRREQRVLRDMLRQLADAIDAVASSTTALSSTTTHTHDCASSSRCGCTCACHCDGAMTHDAPVIVDAAHTAAPTAAAVPLRIAAARARRRAAAAATSQRTTTTTTVVDTATMQALLDALTVADETASWYCARLHDEVAAHAAARDAQQQTDTQLRDVQAQLAEQVADAEHNRMALQEQIALLSEQIVSQRT